ncbi:hypothetical protein EJB05_07408, partial [Eragrostis curvula]
MTDKECGLICRVESFIEHQDACNSGRIRGEVVPAVPSTTTLPVIRPALPRHPSAVATAPPPPPELQLLPASTAALTVTTSLSSTTTNTTTSSSHEPHAATKLQLSIGPAVAAPHVTAADDEADVDEEMRRAMEEKAAADAARERAREEAAAAARALEEARRARQRARAELEKACALRDHAARLLAQVTCHACRQRTLAVSMAVGGGEGHGGAAVACDPVMRGGGVGAGI